MNRTHVVLMLLLLALLSYTISSELEHRKEIHAKNATIETQQAQLQEWTKLKLKIDSLKKEHALLWDELHAAQAAAFACEDRTDQKQPSNHSAASDAQDDALP